eukprot:TRINITY_DN37858_c0_g1_i1.p1 TRINITY_DN37858_c0_g1~~TRINITY_DN37858_c0_g1_i1.p1  ORF type:complete len:519 (+),score=199.99 TRINITY_DN37858_c0_g1_i1:89-1558(+)
MAAEQAAAPAAEPPAAGSGAPAAAAPHVPAQTPTVLLQGAGGVRDSWQAFDFDGTVSDFASRYERIIENMQKGTEAKQRLESFTTRFTAELRSSPPGAPVARAEVDKALSFFKGIFVGLLERCREAEAAFADLYSRVASLADPTPLLCRLADLGGEYDAVCAALRSERSAAESLRADLLAAQKQQRRDPAVGAADSSECEQLRLRVSELEELARGKQVAAEALRRQLADSERLRRENDERLLACEDALRAGAQDADGQGEALREEAAYARAQAADAMAACQLAERERDEARAKAAAAARRPPAKERAAQTDPQPGELLGPEAAGALRELAAALLPDGEWADPDSGAGAVQLLHRLGAAGAAAGRRLRELELELRAACHSRDMALRERDRVSIGALPPQRGQASRSPPPVAAPGDAVIDVAPAGGAKRAPPGGRPPGSGPRAAAGGGDVVSRAARLLLAYRSLRLVAAAYAVALHVLVAGVLYAAARTAR